MVNGQGPSFHVGSEDVLKTIKDSGLMHYRSASVGLEDRA